MRWARQQSAAPSPAPDTPSAPVHRPRWSPHPHQVPSYYRAQETSSRRKKRKACVAARPKGQVARRSSSQALCPSAPPQPVSQEIKFCVAATLLTSPWRPTPSPAVAAAGHRLQNPLPDTATPGRWSGPCPPHPPLPYRAMHRERESNRPLHDPYSRPITERPVRNIGRRQSERPYAQYIRNAAVVQPRQRP